MAKAKIVQLFPMIDVEPSLVAPNSFGVELHAFRLPLYSQGQHCPNCGRQAWYIQRTSAECGHCSEVLALRHGSN